jgi:hypothetical protein
VACILLYSSGGCGHQAFGGPDHQGPSEGLKDENLGRILGVILRPEIRASQISSVVGPEHFDDYTWTITKVGAGPRFTLVILGTWLENHRACR